MTLKSSNIQYVKLIGFIGVLAAVGLLSPSRPAEAENSIPALQGAAAITYLKEHKLYDSLRAALKASFDNEQKLIASDGAQAGNFGFTIAASGSIVVVGARGDNSFQGAAYVFSRQGGSWVETQKLTASDGAGGEQFSDSVAVSGSTIVVGTPTKDAVYVFSRDGGSWVETQKLTASDAGLFDNFGRSVAVSGSTIVVGAPGDDIGSNDAQGSVYVFNRKGGLWVETQKLTASDGLAGDVFGVSVGISGSTLVVGASFDDIGSNFTQGSVYVFNRQGGGWVETQKLTASDGAQPDAFGDPVAISGSIIVVGASSDDVDGNINQGSAYVFTRHGGSWVETQKLTAEGTDNDIFAVSVAVSDSTIVIGASLADVGDNVDQGAAYVFDRRGGSWVLTQKLTSSDGTPVDNFGRGVAVSGSFVAVGAPFVDIDGKGNQGAAYIFEP